MHGLPGQWARIIIRLCLLNSIVTKKNYNNREGEREREKTQKGKKRKKENVLTQTPATHKPSQLRMLPTESLSHQVHTDIRAQTQQLL